ncbi:MAG: hypothetical protein LQ350_003882 [Teloschistes chrysophthalmus]|nr:MAG: hypothetical protein LQ350_003882 [Niorma chrysophthalma]
MDSTTPADGHPDYYVGQHESKRQLPISFEALRMAKDAKYDMLTSPITTPLFQSRVLALLSNHLSDIKNLTTDLTATPKVAPLSAADTPLTPGEVIQQLVGVASPWIDLASPDPVVFNISRQVLELEVQYAAFCGLGNVIVPGPRLQYGGAHGEGITQYAFAIQDALALSNFTQLLIHLPMMYHPDQDSEDVEGSLVPFARPEYMEEGVKAKHDFLGTWDAWQVIRSISLSIPRHLPNLHAQSRWHSEPLRLLSLNAQTFHPATKGDHPFSLTKAHEALIHRYIRLRTPPWILLCDVGPIPGLAQSSFTEARVTNLPLANGVVATNTSNELPTPAEASQQPKFKKIKNHPTPHLAYILDLLSRQPPLSTFETFSSFFQDYLQGPLQPLAHNLESLTYEVFEKDAIKYDLYESAIRKALVDWREKGVGGSKSSNTAGTSEFVVCVAGAGRGPLVARAMKAAKDAGVAIDLWAVEKNPNAYVLLQRHNEEEWNNAVHLVHSDMRTWTGPHTVDPPHHHQPPDPSTPPQRTYPIDILISELLGSFADNELSPECLDGATRLLSQNGISIPCSYTSYLTPIAAPKLHADIARRSEGGERGVADTPWVVMLSAFDYLSTTTSIPNTNTNTTANNVEPIIQAAWSFTHSPPSPSPSSPPSPSSSPFPPSSNKDNNHNTRQTRLTFPIPHRAACHGLAGYFEALLYDNIHLSTNPLTAEKYGCGTMGSWFPIFFPLKTPLYTPDASSLAVTIRRVTDARKVWYEWVVESFLTSSPPPSPPGGKGKKVRLGISEVGSSRESGCMM